MRINILHRSLLIVLVLASTPAAITAAELSGVNQTHSIDIPAWFKNSFLDISEDVQDAAAASKRVMLFFHQDGCGSCRRFYDTTFGDPSVHDKTRRHFDVIAIDINGARQVTDIMGETLLEEDFARNMKSQVTPTVVFLTENGTTALRLPGYTPPEKFIHVLDYVAGHHENRLGLDEYLRSKGF